MPFDCPTCGKETNKLIGDNENKRVGCPFCTQEHRFTIANLHQTVESSSDGKIKISRGKFDELSHRTIAEDGVTIVDRRTGRDAQY